MNKQFKNDFLQNEPLEMGLFTFYKQQQSQSQTINTKFLQHENASLKNKSKKGRKKKFVFQYSQKSQQSQETKIAINKSMNCHDFLKNIRPKRSLRCKQSFTKRQILNSSSLKNTEDIGLMMMSPVIDKSGQDDCLDVEGEIQLRYSNKKFDLGNASNEQSLPAYIIRKKYFNSERNKELIPHQTKKIQQKLIIKIQKKELLRRKFTKEASIKLQERLKRNLDKSKIVKVQSNREMESMRNCKQQQLHLNNQKYVHSLIKKPQYNQTANRILRQTLKLPSFNQRFKTQANPLIDSNIQTFKEYKVNQLKQKRSTYYQHKYLKIPIEKMLNLHKFAQA